MRKSAISSAFFFCILLISTMYNDLSAQHTFDYPETRKDASVIDDYHGTMIPDPYRWLEDDNSEETTTWVEAQNKVTFDHLDNIPFRDSIAARLTELLDYERVSAPFKQGDYFYFYKNEGLQNQSILYRDKSMDGSGDVVLDPNKLSEDGTTSLAGTSFNKDGSLMGYLVSEGGSDWRTAYVLDLQTGKLLSDKIEWIKFSGLSWKGDGFYYSRYPAANEDQELSGENKFHQVYFHKLGTPQSEDVLIIKDEEHPNRNFYVGTSEEEDLLIINPVESTSGNSLYVKDISKDGQEIIKIVENFDNDYSVVDYRKGKLIVQTNYNAPNKRLIQIDLADPGEENWKDFIAESKDNMSNVSIVGNKLFINYLQNANSVIKVYNRDGSYIKDLKLPGIGSASGISGKKEDELGFFNFNSFTVPSSIYKLNTETLEYDLYRKSEVKFDGSQYETKQLWYASKDGTKIPMFVTHKKGLELDGTNPTLLYGYGGFNISLTPRFSTTRIPLLENGGVFVVANLRGGGEFGSDWHKSGTLERKQNVFDDFIGAAEHLIKEGYTSSDKLAIEGGSNGGLLVGASITQRPDLFQVAFPAVGVLDMLRYHKFTIGWAWATDYGRSDEPEAFEYLIKYSPLHNVKAVDYPSVLVTTADHDDRVVPAHSFKFISELQDKHTGSNPVLIRIEPSAGHGAGKPTDKVIQEQADKLAFMLNQMNETYNINK